MTSPNAGPRSVDARDGLRAGVVGLGEIGGGVAVSLARRGRVPTVYDVRAGAADGLDGVSSCAASVAEVARQSDIVMVAVVTAEQARDVIFGPEGIAAGARPGLVVALLSTVNVDAALELGTLCTEAGLGFLDAAVTGGADAAANGLTVLVGGDAATLERARPVLNDFAKRVIHCGVLGAGMITKLARNALTYSVWAAVRESATIATAGGVSLDTLLEVLQDTEGGTSPLTLLRVHAAGINVPEERVQSADALAQKDLAAVQDFAGKTGIEVPIVDLARPRMRAVYSGAMPEPLPVEPWSRGLEMLDRVYGPGFSNRVPRDTTVPSTAATVERLFGSVWARPYLTVRDRRLLTLGATAAAGRADAIKTQLHGALVNSELTSDQIREIVLHLFHYVGWPNGSVVQDVAERIVFEQDQANVDRQGGGAAP